MLSSYKKEDKILLAGPYPNPLGGVSIHTKRLFFLLKDEGYNVHLFKLNKILFPGLQWLLFVFHLLTNSYDVVHLQIYEPKLLKWIVKKFKKKETRVILTIHNPKVTADIKSLENTFNKLDTIIAVGENIFEAYKENRIDLTTKLKVVPSYLAPNKAEENLIVNNYPEKLFSFIKNKDKVMLINASRLVLLDNGVDLYGVKTSIDLLSELKSELNIGLIVAIGDNSYNSNYYSHLKNYIDQLDLVDDVYFFNDEMEIWPIFKKINLFLRPTYYDGFGISVAEAIDMGCAAIASNVCKRADGAIIYEYGNFEELKLKAKEALL